MTGPDRSIHYPNEPWKPLRVHQLSCYMWCQNSDKFFNTQWNCSDCGMPLCQVSRADNNKGRQYYHIMKHKLSGNLFIGCENISHRMPFILSGKTKKFIRTRSQLQWRAQHQVWNRKAERNLWKLIKAVSMGAVSEMSDANVSWK